MAKTIEVIITRSKREIGKLGQRKHVKFGYFRNFLHPKGFAIKATKENQQIFKAIERRELDRLEGERDHAQTIQNAVNGKEIRIEASSTETGKLYGSVNDTDIVSEIARSFSVDVKADAISIKHIKEVGHWTVLIDIHPEIEIKCVVEVFSREMEEAKEKQAQREQQAERMSKEAEEKAKQEEANAESSDASNSDNADATSEAQTTDNDSEETNAQ